jgi:hypothetical protein
VAKNCSEASSIDSRTHIDFLFMHNTSCSSTRAKYLRPKKEELNFEDEGGESKRCIKKRKNLTKMKTSKKKRTLKSSARAPALV